MNQPNANFFDWENTHEDSVLPTGCMHVALVELEDGTSNTGKRMFKGRMEVKGPAEAVGMSHFENYVTGTEENLMGINAGTMGARELKKMFKAAQVPPSNDINQLILSAKDSEFLIVVNQYEEKDGPYAGSKRCRISQYLRLGERQPMIEAAKGAPGQATGLPPGQPSPFAAPTGNQSPPVQQQQPAAPPAAPVGQTSVATPATAPPAPAAPPVQAPPAAVQAPPPVAPVQQAPPTAPAQAAPAAPAEESMPCTICGARVPMSQFGAHIQAHSVRQG